MKWVFTNQFVLKGQPILLWAIAQRQCYKVNHQEQPPCPSGGRSIQKVVVVLVAGLKYAAISGTYVELWVPTPHKSGLHSNYGDATCVKFIAMLSALSFCHGQKYNSTCTCICRNSMSNCDGHVVSLMDCEYITFLIVAPWLTTGCSWTPTAPLHLTFCFIDAKVPTLHPVIILAPRWPSFFM